MVTLLKLNHYHFAGQFSPGLACGVLDEKFPTEGVTVNRFCLVLLATSVDLNATAMVLTILAISLLDY